MKAQPIAERIEKYIRQEGGCHIWTGAQTPLGYGRVAYNGRNAHAHRVAYEIKVGPIPEGLVLDHLCRRPSCVNPEHLEPVTQRENILRGISIVASHAKKKTCKYGHPMDDGKRFASQPYRRCPTCRERQAAEAYARRKEEGQSRDV